jgi:purine-cytosine permease-like protein
MYFWVSCNILTTLRISDAFSASSTKNTEQSYNKHMHAVRESVAYCLIAISLLILEYAIYVYLGPAQNKVPLIIGGILVCTVLMITLLALYQSIKHRHDKEEW